MEETNTASRQIAEITGVIDSIALQTSIPALNVVVEAASSWMDRPVQHRRDPG